jgi:hypothetical protein
MFCAIISGDFCDYYHCNQYHLSKIYYIGRHVYCGCNNIYHIIQYLCLFTVYCNLVQLLRALIIISYAHDD